MSSFAQFDDDFGADHPSPSPSAVGPDHDIFDDVIQSKSKEALQKAWASKDPLGFSWEHKTESEKHVARLEAQLARVVKGESALENQRKREEEEKKRREAKNKKTTKKGAGTLEVDELGMALNYHEAEEEPEVSKVAQNSNVKGRSVGGFNSQYQIEDDDDRNGHVVDVREDGEADEEPMLGWDLRGGEKDWKAYLKAERKDNDDDDEDEDDDDGESEEKTGSYVERDDEEGDEDEEEDAKAAAGNVE